MAKHSVKLCSGQAFTSHPTLTVTGHNETQSPSEIKISGGLRLWPERDQGCSPDAVLGRGRHQGHQPLRTEGG